MSKTLGGEIGVIGEGLLEVGFGPEVTSDQLRRGYGGDAANIAVMCAKMGTPSRLLTRVGDDAAGRALRSFWEREGVSREWVAIDPTAPTGIYVNELLPGGGHHFDYHRTGSAAGNISLSDLDGGFFDGLGAMVLTGITLSLSSPASQLAAHAVAEARRRDITFAMVANCRPARSPDVEATLEMLRVADIALLSDEDADHLLGTSAPEHILSKLGRESKETVITLGSRGALLSFEGKSQTFEPMPIDPVIDRAGAGDALAGAFLALRAERTEPGQALATAIVVASLSCRHAGCALSYPDRSEVCASLEGAYNDSR